MPALRAATRTQHDRVDRLMDLRRMEQPAHYRRVLQVFDVFLPAWEAHVTAALPAARGEWLRRRSRRPFLQQDLRVLGVPRLASSAALPALAGAAAAWGSVYVVEGSALGGKLISRSLARAGLHPTCGAAYFHGWGDAASEMWKETRTLLERELANPDSLAQACRAARGTFDALSDLLQDHLDERAAAA